MTARGGAGRRRPASGARRARLARMPCTAAPRARRSAPATNRHDPPPRRRHRTGHRLAGRHRLAAAWDSIRNARSGIAPITRFDASTFPTRIAGEVKDFDVGKYLSAKEARRYDTFIHYGLVATMEAVSDAGLDDYRGDKERVGVCIGSGIGGLPLIEDTKETFLAGGCARSPRSSCRARSST